MENLYSVKTKIHNYLDHRLFLKDIEQELRDQGVFSHRKINRICGFSSPNYLQLVTQGKRNLSEEGARKVCKTFGLSSEDTELFLEIMTVNLEPQMEKRVILLQGLLKHPAFLKRHLLSEKQLALYLKWFNVPLREILRIYPDLSAKELGACLIPAVSESEIIDALKLMQDLNLIEPFEGGWRVVHDHVISGNEVLFHAIRYFHSAMIELAKQSIERFKSHEREVAAVTMSLTENQFLELKERIRQFKKECLALETRDSGSRVFQFNFQLFPVSKAPERTEK
jgi:uncharacterized protein (TIGR02147 family)